METKDITIIALIVLAVYLYYRIVNQKLTVNSQTQTDYLPSLFDKSTQTSLTVDKIKALENKAEALRTELSKFTHWNKALINKIITYRNTLQAIQQENNMNKKMKLLSNWEIDYPSREKK